MFTKNMSESLGARCFTTPKDSIKESRPGFEKARKQPRTALASVKMCPHISRSRLRPLPRVLLLTSFAPLLLGGTSHPWWRSRGIINAPRARSLGSSRPRTPSDLGRAASARSESLRCVAKAVGVIKQRTCPWRLPGYRLQGRNCIPNKGPFQSPP